MINIERRITMYHRYIAEDTTNHIEYSDECLHEITRKVRNHMKLCHGNLIRTAMLEEGYYYAYGYGRKKNNSNIFYAFRFHVERY